MPLKLNVGLSRKLGLPQYSSVGALCHLEVELPASLLDEDLEGAAKGAGTNGKRANGHEERTMRRKTAEAEAAEQPGNAAEAASPSRYSQV